MSIMFPSPEASNTKLFKLRQRLLEVSSGLSLDRYEAVVEFYIQMLPHLMEVERCTIFIYDQKAENVCSIYGTGLSSHHISAPVSESIAGKSIYGGISVIENNLDTVEGFHLYSDQQTGFASRSVLCVPIKSVVRKKVIGAVQLLNKKKRQPFVEKDRKTLEKVIEGLSASLEAALLNKEIFEIANGLDQELNCLETLSAGENEFIVKSKVMQKTLQLVRTVSEIPVNVLLSGENGTGKELIAQMIHYGPGCEGKPFVPVNCACIPELLAESEFFGHTEGAFTGAEKARKGRFEEATGGTLFLDEIGDLPYAIQAKFLRAIEQGEGSPLGSNQVEKYDFRLISASNKKLSDEVKKGTFREDLFFRLFSIEIEVPPLRKRQADILPLALSFLKQTNARFGKHVTGFSSEVLNLFENFTWPGNVRQLLKEVEREVVLTRDGKVIQKKVCSPEILKEELSKGVIFQDEVKSDNLSIPLRVKKMELELIALALAKSKNNKSKAARLLAVSRQGLLKKIKRYGL